MVRMGVGSSMETLSTIKAWAVTLILTPSKTVFWSRGALEELLTYYPEYYPEDWKYSII